VNSHEVIRYAIYFSINKLSKARTAFHKPQKSGDPNNTAERPK
jgi:hypothetical protein